MKAALAITLYLTVLAQHEAARPFNWDQEPLRAPASIFVNCETAYATGNLMIFAADTKENDETGNSNISFGDANYPLGFEISRRDLSENLPHSLTGQCLGHAAEDDLAMVGVLIEEEMQVFPAVDNRDDNELLDSKQLEKLERLQWEAADSPATIGVQTARVLVTAYG
ncbi:hypothetical protein ACHAPQ_005896 [Fusarium lateritium]